MNKNRNSLQVRLTRRAVIVASIASTALVAQGLGPGVRRSAAQSKDVRIGFQKFSTTLLVLKAQGTLEQDLGPLGYTVTWNEFAAGVPLLEALNAGSIDFGATGAPPPIFAQAAGADLIYAFASRPSPQQEGILVPQGSPINDVAGLKGKKVAVTKGSNAHGLLLASLQKAGLADSDIEFVFLPPADAKPAFGGGNVDSWSIWDPYYALEETDSGARSLVNAEHVGQQNRTFYLATRTFATEHPEALATIGAAIEAAETWSEENKADVVALVSSETGIAEPTLLKAEERRGFGLDPVNAAVIEEQQALADLFHGAGLIPEPIEVAKANLETAAS